MIVINLFGGPGSGKSTTAAGLFHFMKMHGHNVELVTEYAKELTYDQILHQWLDRQEVIFAEQNQRLHRLRNSVDYVITDSPLLLSPIYHEYNRDIGNVNTWAAYPQFRDFVIAVHNTYDNRNFMLVPPENHLHQQTGRLHSKEQADELSDRILNWLWKLPDDLTLVGIDKNTVHTIAHHLKLYP